MKKAEFIRTTSALDWSGNIRRESIFTPQGWEGFEDSWHKHQWLKQHFGQEVSTVGPHMWELLTERHSVMILEENDGVYRERHPTDWYDCAHCDAGYPDQECTCKCEHGVTTIKECIVCTMKSMNPENFLIKEQEVKAIESLKEVDQKCECFCHCSQKTDGTCNLCDQCIDECDPYEKPW